MKTSIDPVNSAFKVLVMEDENDTQKLIMDAFSLSFSRANVEGFRNFVLDDFEKKIINEQYTVITLDGSLSRWIAHPRFGSFGWNFIRFIKEFSPNTIVIAMSGEDEFNEKMMSEGATFAIKKNTFIPGYLKKIFNPDFTLKALETKTTS